MTEADIQSSIRIALGRLRHVRLFRNNRGQAWMGKVIHHDEATVTLLHPRRVEFGLTDGASDLVGMTQITIGPEHIGRTFAVFTAAEVKRPRVTVPQHQQDFVGFVTGFGGIAGVVRSADDALKLIGGP